MSKEKKNIAQDYIEGKKELQPFFSCLPGQWQKAIEQRKKFKPSPFRSQDIEELVEWNEKIGNGKKAWENIECLNDTDTFIVTTGQQPGLLGGPMFTFLKIMAAIKLSQHLSRSLGIKCFPMFWIASEDINFKEVQSYFWLDKQGNIQEFIYEPDNYVPGQSLFSIPLEDKLGELITRLDISTFATEFKLDLLKLLKETLQKSDDLEEQFARLISHLFKDEGLVLITPRLNCIREKAVPLIKKELNMPGVSSELVNKAGKTLLNNGYQPSLKRPPNSLNIFMYEQGIRCPVFFADNHFSLSHPFENKVIIKYSRHDVLKLLSDEPARFAFNVITRPIAQDSLFPTLAYIAGPGEISYFAQLAKVYEHFNTPMPIIFPRPRALLIEPRIEQGLNELGLNAEGFLAGSIDHLQSRILQAGAGQEKIEVISRIEDEAKNLIEALKNELAADEPAIEKSITKLQNNIDLSFARLKERYIDYLKSQETIEVRRIEKIANAVRPLGKEQERVFGLFFPYWLNFGAEVLQFLKENISLEKPGLQVIYLSKLQNK